MLKVPSIRIKSKVMRNSGWCAEGKAIWNALTDGRKSISTWELWLKIKTVKPGIFRRKTYVYRDWYSGMTVTRKLRKPSLSYLLYYFVRRVAKSKKDRLWLDFAAAMFLGRQLASFENLKQDDLQKFEDAVFESLEMVD